MAMPNASMPAESAPKATKPKVTLRALLEARRAEGRTMSVEEAIAVIVPICLELQTRHSQGERLLVHPSSIAAGIDGIPRVEPQGAFPPANPFDRHCLAPELQQTLAPGDACSSVYSVGAILYEMVTGQHVGPGMKRPRELDGDLPEALEILIGKAIIGDRSHRPGDLGALASAMYHVAPQKSVHPPEISEERLDASAELEVDVRFSMLPPSEIAYRSKIPTVVAEFPQPAPVPTVVTASAGGDPFRAPIIDRTKARQESGARITPEDPTTRLAALKARLESDPRSRYVVNKQRMDHGPFTAVELLQQIASGAFVSEDILRDAIGGEQMPIAEWEEFASFAEQSLLVQEKRAEHTAVVRAADADKKRGIAKTIVAASFVLALAGVLAVWFFTRRGTRDDSVVVSNDRNGTIEINGDIKGKKGKNGAAGHGVGGVGYSGGQSYEAVLNSNNETVTMGEQAGAPDLSNAQLAGPLRSASFVPGCGAPDDMKVTVRVAVRMGVPIGVTVVTSPASHPVAACIDHAVRGLRWAASAKTDFVTTSY
jgi:hypothetical protein